MVNREASMRSKIRAWSFYAALGYSAVTVTVVGLSIGGLAERAGVASPYKLHNIFIARLVGALLGTAIAGPLIDSLPMKRLMFSCMLVSALSLLAIPFLASFGPEVLIMNFGLLGLSCSALVTCATTAACWAFPGEKVAQINSGMAAAFGVTSASLPLLLLSAHGQLDIQYVLSVALVLPAMILLVISDTPVKPDAASKYVSDNTDNHAQSKNSEGKRECMNWLMALTAATSQLLLQGAYSSLVVWLPEFGKQRISGMQDNAALLVSVLQGSVTLGSLVAMQFQKRFELLNLACGQLLVVVANLFVWNFFSGSAILGCVAVVGFGLFGGSTLGYSSSLYNRYTTPTGKQLSLINLGSNAGASLGPFTIGLMMSSFGPCALIASALVANSIVLVGMVSLKVITFKTIVRTPLTTRFLGHEEA